MNIKEQEIKSALWDAANTLRGSAVDRTDWKGYILPLLFFKRISDVWDEETVEAAELYGGAIALESSDDLGGLLVRLTLPAAV